MGVYFVLAKQTKRIKIGYTSQIKKRFSVLQNTTPDDLELLLYDNDLGRADEQEFHRIFHEDRIAGEWFEYSSSLQSFILIAQSFSDTEGLSGFLEFYTSMSKMLLVMFDGMEGMEKYRVMVESMMAKVLQNKAGMIISLDKKRKDALVFTHEKQLELF